MMSYRQILAPTIQSINALYKQKHPSLISPLWVAGELLQHFEPLGLKFADSPQWCSEGRISRLNNKHE